MLKGGDVIDLGGRQLEVVMAAHAQAGLSQLSDAAAYPPIAARPTMMADPELQPGMTFAFGPNYGFGRRTVTIGATVVVGRDEAVELNPLTARILRT